MALFQPSFRGRLRLFFAVIVIVPMIAVGFVLFRLVSKTDEGRIDARLSEAANGTTGLLVQDRQRAAAAARTLARDPGLAAALQARKRARIQDRLAVIAPRAEVRRVRIDVQGLGPVEWGGPPALAPSRLQLQAAGGGNVGPMTVSTTGADAFATAVR